MTILGREQGTGPDGERDWLLANGPFLLGGRTTLPRAAGDGRLEKNKHDSTFKTVFPKISSKLTKCRFEFVLVEERWKAPSKQEGH